MYVMCFTMPHGTNTARNTPGSSEVWPCIFLLNLFKFKMYLSFIYLLLLNVYVSMLGMCMDVRDVRMHNTL